jgi:LPS O-antigen subunit length determinant protein (WzzB/FepE family)
MGDETRNVDLDIVWETIIKRIPALQTRCTEILHNQRFSQRESGEVVIDNASANAIRKAQEAFAGVAEELGNPGEEEIQSWVDEIRYGRKGVCD